jgi:hypothetical protein
MHSSLYILTKSPRPKSTCPHPIGEWPHEQSLWTLPLIHQILTPTTLNPGAMAGPMATMSMVINDNNQIEAPWCIVPKRKYVVCAVVSSAWIPGG